ncbi:hypothetical protein DIE19_19765 [Burkholderia sp. Bp9126]|nr:hypothetical protein DIE19_19765 [Burkholderia sp. Bp9126]
MMPVALRDQHEQPVDLTGDRRGPARQFERRQVGVHVRHERADRAALKLVSVLHALARDFVRVGQRLDVHEQALGPGQLAILDQQPHDLFQPRFR